MRAFVPARGQRGSALLVVVMLGLAMMILTAGAITVVSSGLRAASTDQDGSAATDAAYSGVQDYLVRFNADASYAQYGNSASKFTLETGSSVVPATGNTANPAFDVSGSTWARIPGSPNAFFRYEVDNHLWTTNGVVRIRSTGRVGTATRSLVASLHQKGFTDYVYFSDYEMQDPRVSGVDPTTCMKYSWAGRSDDDCGTIRFAKGDVIQGPVHTNDRLLVCGATFTAPVETGRPGGGVESDPGCSDGTGSYPAHDPAYPVQTGTLTMPASNSAMMAQTDLKSTSTPGCLYTGPTTVTLLGDGTMRVVSPWTKHTVMNGPTGFSDAFAVQCGDVAALNSPTGAVVPVPPNNVVYVQTVPTEATNPNSWPTTAVPPNLTCLASDGVTALTGSTASAGWSYSADGTTLRHPLKGEYPAQGWRTWGWSGAVWSTDGPAYGCRSGDVYVQGVLRGRVSIASDNYVYVTGDVTTRSRTTDVLGLVGVNGVIVANPLKVKGGDLVSMLGDTNRSIDASLLSTAHTFTVQNYADGPARGQLSIFGSIAQRFRGPVGANVTRWTGSAMVPGIAGYLKQYVYDERLQSIAPPYFLTPSLSSFRVSGYASVSPGFNADGVNAP